MVAPHKLGPSDTLRTFLSSPAYSNYLLFVQLLCESVKGQVVRPEEDIPKNVQNLLNILERLDTLISECPLKTQSTSRFGNLAYRNWYTKMAASAREQIHALLPTIEQDTLQLLSLYFLDSFGNSTRIDYGTGHEGAFVFLLCCLHKLCYLRPQDARLTALVIFKRYLNLVRKLQKTFLLEPAGSHGSWGLDDYQFLPFLLGAAQMITADCDFTPEDILNKKICNEYKDDYLFFGGIDFIHQVSIVISGTRSKKAHFPTILVFFILLVRPSRGKKYLMDSTKCILLRCFYHSLQFMSKFPIVQHFWFGDLMPLRASDIASTSLIPD